MKDAMRVIVTFLAFVASYFFIYWLPLSLIPGLHQIPTLPNIIALLIAVAISILVWRKTSATSNNLAYYIIVGGIIVGAIGFIIGFFGPIIFRPDAAQGPLLGIFFTGPLGFILGLIGGAVYWKIKGKKQLEKA